MHSDYHNPIIRQLRDQQVRFAPREKKIEQVNRAEKLLSELDARPHLHLRVPLLSHHRLPARVVPQPEAHRSRSQPRSAAVRRGPFRRGRCAGQPGRRAGAHRRRAEQAVQGLDQDDFALAPAGAGEPPLRVRRPQARRLPAELGRPVRVQEPGARPPRRPLQPADRRRAGRDRRAGPAPGQCRRRPGGRDQADRQAHGPQRRDHPLHAQAVRPRAPRPWPSSRQRGGPLGEEDKQKIYQQYRRGESVETLAKRYRRTKTSIYRIINEMRARRIMELPLDYIPNTVFGRSSMEKADAGDDAGPGNAGQEDAAARGFAALSGQPVRGAAADARAGSPPVPQVELPEVQGGRSCAKRLDPAQAKSSLMDQIEALYEQAVAMKNQIVRANLRLVVSIAKRHVGPWDNFFELVSDGNMSLIRAVEKFDYARGNKFSTYASWAIMKNFARTIPDEHRQHDRFRTSHRDVRRHRGVSHATSTSRNRPSTSARRRSARSSTGSTSASRRSSLVGSGWTTARSRKRSRKWAPRWA